MSAAADTYAEAVTIGQVGNQIQALACNTCGVLVWDFDKHAEHAHGWGAR